MSNGTESPSEEEQEVVILGEVLLSDPDYWPRNDWKVWGKLIPTQGPILELRKKATYFGREEESLDEDDEVKCDFPLAQPAHYRPYYSLKHFCIRKIKAVEHCGTWVEVVQVVDCSRHGTYINGRRLLKDKPQFLRHRDIISLANRDNRVFVYFERNYEDLGCPKELQEKYNVRQQLGNGSFGQVVLCFSMSSERPHAAKIIRPNSREYRLRWNRGWDQGAMEEVTHLASLSHLNVIHLDDVIKTKEALIIVMEFVAGGDLFRRLIAKDFLSEWVAKLYFFQILLALQYLHSKKICHRDLKPENILLAENADVTLIKLTDFGLSKTTENRLKSFVGTNSYIAPEIWKITRPSRQSYGTGVDLWSAGVLLYQCLCGEKPYEGCSQDVIQRRILEDPVSFHQLQWVDVSWKGMVMVESLLKKNPLTRPPARDAIQSRWFQNDRKLYDNLKHLNLGLELPKSLFLESPLPSRLSREERLALERIPEEEVREPSVAYLGHKRPRL